MTFAPLDRMWQRTQRAKDHSDSEFFRHLLLTGEFLTKLVAIGLIASVDDDRERHRYRHEYRVVRASGLGDWSQTITEIVVGPTARFVIGDAQTELQELNERVQSGTWQYDSLELLHQCLKIILPSVEGLSRKTDAKKWFMYFVTLRNKTRGHGAEPSKLHSDVAKPLEQSIALWIENYHLFKRPWAYLHQNLSGKYRVTKLTEDTSPFDHLRSKNSYTLSDGVYIFYGAMVRTNLLSSDVDASDFWVPNGNWSKSSYEELSYITSNTRNVDGARFSAPVSAFPVSETQGNADLDVVGNAFSNLPPSPRDYIARKQLESDLRKVLLSTDRYPVVTLVGRGGIGKTYLALKVLHELSEEGLFDAIFWFSARDIDLTTDGPKPVKPHVLSAEHIADEFCRLTGPHDTKKTSFEKMKYMEECLRSAQPPFEHGKLMFVFDNFETVNNPAELFSWIDTFVRSPNKILITTRHRDFRGDYPVEVTGMAREEFDILIDKTARRIGVDKYLSESYRQDLFEESDGHPYVAKILLGEIAREGRPIKVTRIIANRENILDALFERTYQNLSAVARRVFLTLCNWRSIVPVVALEAVLLRPSNERMDIEVAIDELAKCSFTEVLTPGNDSTEFLNVPLVAKIFGSRKLKVSPIRSAIEADTQFLHAFGAMTSKDVVHGMHPRIDRMIRYIDNKLLEGEESIERYEPVLEFVATKYPSTWLKIATLYETHKMDDWIRKSELCLRRYLEYNPDNLTIWNRLIALYRRIEDDQAIINSLVSMCMAPGIPYDVLSNSANELNKMFHQVDAPLETYEKEVVVWQLAELLEERIEEATADDCSRLAWLHLQLRNTDKAKIVVDRGLDIDPLNEHCENLRKRLANTEY